MSCNERKSKNNLYSKQDLILLAMKKGMTKSNAQKNTKKELCDYLNLDKPIQKKSPSSSESKLSSPKKKSPKISKESPEKSKFISLDNPYSLNLGMEYKDKKIRISGCIKQNKSTINKKLANILSKNPGQREKINEKDVCIVSVDFVISSFDKCYLTYFYNYPQQYIDQFQDEKELLENTKGLGLVLLQICLHTAIKNDLLSKTAVIDLLAAGGKEGKQMQGLISYYRSLGFKLKDDNCINLCSMIGNVNSIIVKVPKISNKMKDLLLLY